MKKVFLIIALFAFIILPMRVLAEDKLDNNSAEAVGDKAYNECRGGGGSPGSCEQEAAAAYSHREREIKSDGNAQEREQLKNDDKKREEETKKKEAAKATGTTIPGSVPTSNGLTGENPSLAPNLAASTPTTQTLCIKGDYETDCIGKNEEHVKQCGPAGTWIREYNQNNPNCDGTAKTKGQQVANSCLTGAADAKDCTAGTGGKVVESGNAISADIMNKKDCNNGDWETACVGDGMLEDVAKCVDGKFVRQSRQTNADCSNAKKGEKRENLAAQEGTRLHVAATFLEKNQGCFNAGEKDQGKANSLCGTVYGLGSSCNSSTGQCNLPVQAKEPCKTTDSDKDGHEYCASKGFGGAICGQDGFCVNSVVSTCPTKCDIQTESCQLTVNGNPNSAKCMPLNKNYCFKYLSGAIASRFLSSLGTKTTTDCDSSGCDESTGRCVNSKLKVATSTYCDGQGYLTTEYTDGTRSYEECSMLVNGTRVMTGCNGLRCGTLSDVASVVPSSMPRITVAPPGSVGDGNPCTQDNECKSGVCRSTISSGESTVCVPKALLSNGNVCRSDFECNSGWCNIGVCEDKKLLANGNECQLGRQCVSGKCNETLVGVQTVKTCGPDQSSIGATANSACPCVSTLRCDTATNTCQK